MWYNIVTSDSACNDLRISVRMISDELACLSLYIYFIDTNICRLAPLACGIREGTGIFERAEVYELFIKNKQTADHSIF